MHYEWGADHKDPPCYDAGGVVHRLYRFDGQHYLMLCDFSVDYDVIAENGGEDKLVVEGLTVTCLECLALAK